ncbi:NAD(P)H-dependent oxidoreductase subunit E [Methylocella sp.]|jgi:[NiFe] hydrogenase diaphorase moiety large subunit|uniref:NADH-quinone oxidoreductase subunit NuoE family protein n=1 Tax=Methylocella sp. TaxID=1978226 RepID=UPI003C21D24A
MRPGFSTVASRSAAKVDAAVEEFGADCAGGSAPPGHISDAAVHAVAAGRGVPAVEVEDMVSFYSFFNREPKGRYHIRLSKTPVSLMQGAAEVARAFATATGASIGGTSPDGEFTIEWTSDIGMADQEPSG